MNPNTCSHKDLLLEIWGPQSATLICRLCGTTLAQIDNGTPETIIPLLKARVRVVRIDTRDLQ